MDAYPLTWPIGRTRTPSNKREFSRFTSGRSRISTYAAVGRIMAQIKAFTRSGNPWVINPDSVVISTNIPTRRDGLPYSNVRDPADPGVAVYFKLRGRDYCLSCDKWRDVASNAAAIAKHLEAMRGMERWGVGDVEAVFAGYKSLPGPGAPAPPMTVETAAAILASLHENGKPWGGDILRDADEYRTAYRLAAAIHHPDRNGDPAKWKTLQECAAVLRAHFHI